MSEVLAADQFIGLTDLPAYNRPPGWLRAQQNLRIRPGGYLEMRGGLDRLKPASGTAVNPVSSNENYLGAIDSVTQWGWVRVYDANFNTFVYVTGGGADTTSDENLATRSYYQLFGSVTGAGPLVTGRYVCIGADHPFGNVTFTLVRAATWAGVTVGYTYGTADGAPPTFSNLTTTSTCDFTTAVTAGSYRETTASWAIPTNWVPTTEGNAVDGYVTKYWVRISLTGGAIGITTYPMQGMQPVLVDWRGMHELYVAAGDPGTSATDGNLYRYVERHTGATTTADWSLAGQTLNTSAGSRVRMASYRGILYVVDGRNFKRIDLGEYEDAGLPAVPITLNTTAGNQIVTNAGPGTWSGGAAVNFRFRYAVTAGYGAVQTAVTRDLSTISSRTYAPTLFGESEPYFFTAAQYPSTLASGVGYVQVLDGDSVRMNLDLTNLNVFSMLKVDALHFYRTNDLNNVDPSAYESMPYFRIFSVYRDASGAWTAGNLDDQRLDHPAPMISLDQEEQSPPEAPTLIWIHKNRMFLGGSTKYPARVFWSKPYQPDAYRTDLDFEDFSSDSSGRLMAGADFMDQSIVFTEDNMYGISDVDVDQFQSYVIAPGIGCIATDALAVSDGVAIWPARDGIYMFTGKDTPMKLTKEMDTTFGKLSYESHGLSRAVIHNSQYEISLISSSGVIGSTYRYDLLTGTWSTVAHNLGSSKVVPLCVAMTTLNTNGANQYRPLYGQTPGHGGTQLYDLYLGELTTADNGSAITSRADIHFGPGGFKHLKPDRVGVYYSADSGWQTVTISSPNSAFIGTDIPAGGVGSGTADSGTNYSLVKGTFKERNTGTQDLVIRVDATSASGGTVGNQRLLAAYLVGESVDPRR